MNVRAQGIHDLWMELHGLKKVLMADFRPNLGNLRLNMSQGRTLMALDHDGPSAMSRLGRTVGLEAGSFTAVADALVEAGLAEKSRDRNDRRRWLLGLTPGGREAAVLLRSEMERHMDRRLGALDPGERTELDGALRTLRAVNEKLRRKHA